MSDRSPLFSDIYKLIYYSNGSSRKQISHELDLSLPTVTNYLQQLMSDGLVYIEGTQDSTGGRKANSYTIVPTSGYSIGIDITKHHYTIVLVDMGENIIDSVRTRIAFADSDDYYVQVFSQIEKLLTRNKINRSKFLGVGISMPVVMAANQKQITYAKVITVSYNIYDKIAKFIKHPFSIYNDANCAGMAEWWATRESKTAVYLSLNPSIGGATIGSNSIVTGTNNRASEFGHVTIVPGGRRCYCGRKGCVDAYCSESILTDFTDGNLEAFFEDLPNNLGFQDVLDSYLYHLSLIINTLRMCYDCDIIIGGNVGSYLDQYIDILKEKSVRLNPFETNADYIRPCQYKTSASAVGAALYIIKGYVDEM